jgi:hypothetical protein
MLEKKTLIIVVKLLSLLILLSNCKSKQKLSKTNERASNNSEQIDAETPPMKAENKVDGNIINAKLECTGTSTIELLQLAEKKHDTKDFTCHISNNDGLKIQFKSESKGMEIIFTLFGIESFNIEKADYFCQSSGNLKFATVILNSKDIGNHNFGDTFDGKISIIDYGMSSNVICGNFQLKDRKGNLIEGKFNEIIQSF